MRRRRAGHERAGPCHRKASAEEAGWQQARDVRSRLDHNGEMAAARRAASMPSVLRVVAVSPCTSTLQRHDELTQHTSEFHASVHGKYSRPQPIASRPAIKKSRCNSAAKPRSGRVAVQRRSRPRRVIQTSHGKSLRPLAAALLKRKWLLRLGHSVRGGHSWGVGSYFLGFFALGQQDGPPHTALTERFPRSCITWARSCFPSATDAASSVGMEVVECFSR